MVKLCPFASSSGCETVSEEASGILPIYAMNCYFLSLNIYFNQFNNFLYWRGKKHNIILFHRLNKRCTKNHFVRVVNLWAK